MKIQINSDESKLKSQNSKLKFKTRKLSILNSVFVIRVIRKNRGSCRFFSVISLIRLISGNSLLLLILNNVLPHRSQCAQW
jgi:hypothetical protein